MQDDDTLQPEVEETPGLESESAPDKTEGEDTPPVEGQTAEPVEGDKDPERFTKRINKKHFELMEERRRAEALEQELAATRARLPTEQRPSVPDLPDPYDADYAVKIEARDQALRDAAAYDARQSVLQEQQQTQAQEAQAKAQAATFERIRTYTERAQKLGIEAEQLQVAGTTVQQYGINDDLADFILDHEQGPQITAYLASNPGELDDLNRLTPIQAAVKLETVIKPKASQLSGISGAPKPAEGLTGGGAPPTQRGPEGATYQ